jgi:polysaccharide pyruvyl transferase WcaK-like protein
LLPVAQEVHGAREKQLTPMARILIVGGDSDSNIGDAAIAVSLCQCLTAARADVRVTLVSRRRGWPSLPRNVGIIPRGPRGLAQLLRAARSHDLVLVGGGGLFQDDDSRIKMPYWAARIALLKAANPNIAGHAIGAGPLQHAESQRCARIACESLRVLSVRDEFAQRWLSRCTHREVPLVPDPAFMLAPAPRDVGRAYIRSLGLDPRRPLIGVALRRWFHRKGGFIPHRVRAAIGLDRGEGREAMTRVLTDVARAVSWLAKRMNASVLLMPSYNAVHEGDPVECQRLRELLGVSVESRIALINDPSLYKSVAGHLSLMLSARMHPLILAASMGVPIVGLAYNGKFEGLFRLLGLQGATVWLDDLRQGGHVSHLVRLATDALDERVDRRHRSEELAELSRSSTRQLLDLVAA